MPASIFSDAELARLAGFPEEIPLEDPIRAFTLTGADLDLVANRRGAANRLGLALQLCALRYLGFVPPDLSVAPQPAVRFVADQLVEHTTDTAWLHRDRLRPVSSSGAAVRPAHPGLGRSALVSSRCSSAERRGRGSAEGIGSEQDPTRQLGRTPPGGRLTQVGLGDRIAPDFEAPDWRKRERLVPSPPRSRAPRQDPVHPKVD